MDSEDESAVELLLKKDHKAHDEDDESKKYIGHIAEGAPDALEDGEGDIAIALGLSGGSDIQPYVLEAGSDVSSSRDRDVGDGVHGKVDGGKDAFVGMDEVTILSVGLGNGFDTGHFFENS